MPMVTSEVTVITSCDVRGNYQDIRGKWGAAIAQWNSLRLPSCCPGFESQANHLSYYFIYSQICAILVIVL